MNMTSLSTGEFMCFECKETKYKSSDLSIDIAFNQLKTVQNDESRLLKIYTDYSHQTEKMSLLNSTKNS